MTPIQQHHFNWLNFLILGGAVAVNVLGSAEVASPGSNPFVSPTVDLSLFNNLLLALKASQDTAPAAPVAPPVMPPAAPQVIG